MTPSSLHPYLPLPGSSVLLFLPSGLLFVPTVHSSFRVRPFPSPASPPCLDGVDNYGYQVLPCTHFRRYAPRRCHREHISGASGAYLGYFVEICALMMPLGAYFEGWRCISLDTPDSSLALRMTGKPARTKPLPCLPTEPLHCHPKRTKLTLSS